MLWDLVAHVLPCLNCHCIVEYVCIVLQLNLKLCNDSPIMSLSLNISAMLTFVTLQVTTDEQFQLFGAVIVDKIQSLLVPSFQYSI